MTIGVTSVLIATTCSALVWAQAPSRPAATPAAPPAVSIVPIPYFNGAHAIWGATGQDARGHIWFGVTTGGLNPDSAHLFEYTPATGAIVDRGNIVEELKRAGLHRAGEHQAKIHSKIVQGPANFIYFASMDEHGENEDGSRLPTWGGHLWRMSLTTQQWEHLLTVLHLRPRLLQTHPLSVRHADGEDRARRGRIRRRPYQPELPGRFSRPYIRAAVA
jgi:hypothetical protein